MLNSNLELLVLSLKLPIPKHSHPDILQSVGGRNHIFGHVGHVNQRVKLPLSRSEKEGAAEAVRCYIFDI